MDLIDAVISKRLLIDEARRVDARLRELGHKYDFIQLSKDLVYSVYRDELLYIEALALHYDKGTYKSFNWVGCKKEIENTRENE